MNEFREAHAHATGSGRNKFLIPILYGDLQVGDLSTEMRFYLENHTYIEYKKVRAFCLFSAITFKRMPIPNKKPKGLKQIATLPHFKFLKAFDRKCL